MVSRVIASTYEFRSKPSEKGVFLVATLLETMPAYHVATEILRKLVNEYLSDEFYSIIYRIKYLRFKICGYKMK